MAEKRRETFLVFGSPLIEEPEINEVVNTLRSGWIGTGPKVERFEEAFREFKGIAHAMAVGSGTAALHLSLISLGLKAGDEVITTPMTFCATLNAIIHAGARPVLVDCERDTFNIDPSRIEAAVTSRTRAILPVHFSGRPCKMDAIMDIAKRRRLAVVEDCAHAVEAEFHGKKVGTFGDAACFSFYVTKNITTGEGGMVVTADARIAERVKILALHGLSKDAWKRFKDPGHQHYEVVDAGFKYNMTDVQASLGIHQIGRIDTYWERRRLLWQRYNAAFAGLGCDLPKDPEPDTRHSFHLYTLLADIDRLGKTRDQIISELTERRIGSGVHYRALHLQPYYRRLLGHKPGDFPNAEFISERTFSLPLSPKLTDEDAADVIAAVTEILK